MAENLSNTGYRPNDWGTPSAGAVTEQATIGASIVIKGEVSGSEPLFINGTVEGLVHCPEHRVTIGRNSTVKADIQAREVAVMGSVKGNIHCSDLVDLRAESNIQGEIVTRRIRIDDGAVLKGSVEIQRAEKGAPAPDVQGCAHRGGSRSGSQGGGGNCHCGGGNRSGQPASIEGGGARRSGHAPGGRQQRTVQTCALEIRCRLRGASWPALNECRPFPRFVVREANFGIQAMRLARSDAASASQVRQPPLVPPSFQLCKPPAQEVQERHRRNPHQVHERQVVPVAGGRLPKNCSVKQPAHRLPACRCHDNCQRVDEVQVQHLEEHWHAAESPQSP